MSGVRVLVGTRKGAFVLTSDGKREQWEVSGPHFAGWEIYHVKGSPGRPEPALRVAVQRLVRPADPALRRRRQDLGAGGQQVRLRRRARHAPVVRRHAAPVGVQAGLAPRAVARPIPTRSTPGSRTPALFRSTDGGQTWQELPGLRGHGSGPHWQPGAGGMCLHTIILDPSQPGPDLRRHLGRGRVPHRRRRRRPGSRSIAACGPSTFPTRPPRSATACTASRMHPSRPDVLFMQKHWDVMRSDDARRLLARGQRQPADRLRLPDRRARARAGDDLRRADQERLGAFPARGQAARLPQPHAAATSGSR